jgi:anti-anti-sigma regulatory factor
LGVLKISWLSQTWPMPTIKLEGELLEPWVSSVREACGAERRRSQSLCLDLSGVTYVDALGARLLRELLREGVKITAGSTFLMELLYLDQ